MCLFHLTHRCVSSNSPCSNNPLANWHVFVHSNKVDTVEYGYSLSGNVVLSAGFMHLLPDAVSATSDSLADSFPMAYFFAALGFYLLFLMQKVVAPMLSGSHVVAGHHGHAHDHNACTTAGGCCAVPASLAPVSVHSGQVACHPCCCVTQEWSILPHVVQMTLCLLSQLGALQTRMGSPVLGPFIHGKSSLFPHSVYVCAGCL